MDEAFLIKWQIDIQLPLHNFAIKVRNTKITPQYSYHKHSKLYKLKLLSRHIYGTMGYVDKIGKSGFGLQCDLSTVYDRAHNEIEHSTLCP